MYGSKVWILTSKHEEQLRRFERKILRRIYGPVQERGEWRIRSNKELEDLYENSDIVTEIKRGRFRWIGHLERMDPERKVYQVHRERPEGRRLRGRPQKRWDEDVEADLRRMGVSCWRRKAQDREEWVKILDEAKVLQGL
ncbi:uncharacterized protein LOC111616447 [Centruroides sculpturatus]|uniref:uncharacterized protein LOC111616447 n=1 Tax=Centruroides sculpturatus TaxID=218467 RepID=UPI000C6EC1F1|nr:uncharacterized protein LOC111616447 [Centruroides sculpturatus]